MIFPVLGTVMGLLFAAVPLWKALNRPARHDPARAEGPVAVPTKPVEPHAVKTVTPATRDWPRNPELKKAMNLIEGLAAIPDDLSLAEEIAKGVLDRSPTDIEAVTGKPPQQLTFAQADMQVVVTRWVQDDPARTIPRDGHPNAEGARYLASKVIPAIRAVSP